jgi:hypothetical protein
MAKPWLTWSQFAGPFQTAAQVSQPCDIELIGTDNTVVNPTAATSGTGSAGILGSIATIITLGFGSFGSVNLLLTLGFGIAATTAEDAVVELTGVDNTIIILSGVC